MTPGVCGNKDASEFTLVLATRGVAHPTGYPLYTLLGSLFVHAAHVCPPRPLVQHPGELRELLRGPGGVHFHAPIVQIARVPGQPEVYRRALREVSEPDALHPPAHEPPPRRLFFVRHFDASITWIANAPAGRIPVPAMNSAT